MEANDSLLLPERIIVLANGFPFSVGCCRVKFVPVAVQNHCFRSNLISERDLRVKRLFSRVEISRVFHLTEAKKENLVSLVIIYPKKFRKEKFLSATTLSSYLHILERGRNSRRG